MKARHLVGWLFGLLLGFSCVTTRPPDAAPRASGEGAEPIAEVLRGFVAAARARQFDVVWGLLSERWRTRATPASLEVDFDAEPLAEVRLRHLEAGLGGPLRIEAARAQLTLGPGRALVLVREDAGWRVDRLE